MSGTDIPQPGDRAREAAPPTGATAPPPGDRPRLADGEWHRLHPLTPLFRGGIVLVIVLGIIISNLRERVMFFFVDIFAPDEADIDSNYSGDPIDWVLTNNLLLLVLLGLLVIVLLLVGGFYMSWRFHTFRITGDDVEVRSGILFRTHRRAPLDRVQAVNLTRPLFARLAGMAKLEVVGAGTDANVKLEYLSTGNAEGVRADILRLASGARAVRRGETPRTRAGVTAALSDGITGLIEGVDTPVAEPESVVHIPTGRLIASYVLGAGTIFLVLAIVAVIVATSFGAWWSIFSLVPMIIGFGAYYVSQIVRALRYSIAPTPDGVRVTFGLFTTVTETLPPGRVHAVEISQSILWRPFGWWRLRINRMTGRSASQQQQQDQFTTVLPVGDRADIERVLGLLLPKMAEAERASAFEYGIAAESTPDGPYRTTPKRAWFIRPLSWRRNGFAFATDAVLLRRGRIWRQVAILPFARLQSFGLDQGPVDRALRIASARAHTVTGPVSGAVAALDHDDALHLLDEVRHRSVEAASADRSHRWAEDEENSSEDFVADVDPGPSRSTS